MQRNDVLQRHEQLRQHGNEISKGLNSNRSRARHSIKAGLRIRTNRIGGMVKIRPIQETDQQYASSWAARTTSSSSRRRRSNSAIFASNLRRK